MDVGIKERYQPVIDALKNRHPDHGKEIIQRAFSYAHAAHQDQLRLSGDPYITHCIEVARILNELEMDYASIAAGLLHDVVEDTGDSLEHLKTEFPAPIPSLVEGVTKISELSLSSARERYVENLRKMLLAMAKDIRVIIIKLSDRLHNMRTVHYLPESKRLSISRDTLEVYAPLANRLGITRIRTELEDLSMMYLYPEDYKKISTYVQERQIEREKFICETTEFLRHHLQQSGLHVHIQGRVKNIYSIYKKLQRQNICLDEVYDLTALRVIVETEEQCWAVLGKIHSLWKPIPDRFKDYVSMPKENMYQSIHTTVVGPEGQPVEIQIRTREMHRIAEAGVAAHWKYKEGVKGVNDFEETLRWLRQITEWIRDVQDPGDFMTALKDEIFADTIFCFTPKGDVIDLPKGTTPLDFAYQIHTEIGNKCKGAIVNNRIVSLKSELQNGDIVKIITGKDAHPSPDWLDIARTPGARAKIRRYLRSQIYNETIKTGEEILLRTLKQQLIPLKFDDVKKVLEKNLNRIHVRSIEQLLADIGFGTLSVQSVLNLIPSVKEKQTIPRPRERSGRKRSLGIILDGMGTDADISIRLAKCCSPLPGENIIGFTTINRGITVHRKDCKNIKRILTEQRPDESRIISASWQNQQKSLQRVSLRIRAWDRKGLLNEIAGTITSHNIDILATSTKSFSRKKQAVLDFLIAVESQDQYNRLIANLKSVRGIVNISRTARHWQ